MKFRYIGCSDAQVQWGGNDDPRGILVEGEVYELWDGYVCSSHTKLEFVDFRGLKFNSVCFEEVGYDLAHVQVIIENVNSMIISAKKEFAEVMADKSYPLEDRWNLFIETSDAFKEHEPFIVRFDFEKTLGIDLLDLCCMERYMVQNTVDIIECTDDSSEESINIMKEEILQKNLGSFVFDW